MRKHQQPSPAFHPYEPPPHIHSHPMQSLHQGDGRAYSRGAAEGAPRKVCGYFSGQWVSRWEDEEEVTVSRRRLLCSYFLLYFSLVPTWGRNKLTSAAEIKPGVHDIPSISLLSLPTLLHSTSSISLLLQTKIQHGQSNCTTCFHSPPVSVTCNGCLSPLRRKLKLRSTLKATSLGPLVLSATGCLKYALWKCIFT